MIVVGPAGLQESQAGNFGVDALQPAEERPRFGSDQGIGFELFGKMASLPKAKLERGEQQRAIVECSFGRLHLLAPGWG